MTPESYGLQLALTFFALLLAALGATIIFKGAREDSPAPALDLTDAAVRIGDGARVLRFLLEVQPTGRAALVQNPVALSDGEFRQLLAFLTDGLLDPKARPENLRKLVPTRLPSGRAVHLFQQ